MHRLVLALALQLVLAGCGRGSAREWEDLGIRDRSILTAYEIEMQKAGAWTAYDVIARLRPEYLRSRGASSLRNTTPPTAVVYLDEMKYGGINSLKSLSAHQILRIEYVNASDATTRFGTDHLGGAILITTK